MKKLRLLFMAMAVLGLVFLAQAVKAQEVDIQDIRQSIEQLVNEAAQLIEDKGEEAISIIADKNGKFYTKDTYVFITSGRPGQT